MQTEEAPANRSLDSEIQLWTELTKRLEEFVKETKDSGKAFEGAVGDELTSLVGQVVDLESRLRSMLRGRGIVDGIPDERTRCMVQKLIEKNAAEAVATLVDDDDQARDPYELHDGAAWNFVYNLGAPADQYLNYVRTASIVSHAELPKRIHELLEEAKICFAIGQSNAVMALGRMILEYTITDIGVRIGRLPEPDSIKDFYKNYPPYERADTILGTAGPRRDRFRKLYDAGSKAIHSSRDSGENVPLVFLTEVIAFVNNEYAINLRG